MRVVILEDEPLARRRLAECIEACDPATEIAASLAGVAEALPWFRGHTHPDLLFADIQLGDGTSFDVLRQVRIECPVVFTTAYDDYVLEAFQTNGIDYLLKPIKQEAVAAALEKYARLRGHFLADHAALAQALRRPAGARERFLVRKGNEFLSVRTADVAYLFSEHKLVFLVTRDGKRYVLDKALTEWESELEPGRFFRLNRNYLVCIDAVARCTPHPKGRLLVELRPATTAEVIVSQERAAAFKRWLGE